MKIIVGYERRYDFREGVSYWFPCEKYEFDQKGKSLLGDPMHQAVAYDNGWEYLDSAMSSDGMHHVQKINDGRVQYKVMDAESDPPIFRIDDPNFEKTENFC